nr:cupredoxin domain-containing protein [Pseudenhygromyxa sp. WMMC2535]
MVIADMDVKKDLRVGETVEIEVEVPESGELGFACGMDMYKGKVVARES